MEEKSFYSNMSIPWNKIHSIYVRDLLQPSQIGCHIPDFQRIIDPERVQSICQTYLQYQTKGKFFPFGCITFAACNSKEWYLIDGQHRFASLKKLYEMGHDIPETIDIQILQCSHPSQMIEYFQLIAQSKEVPEYILHSNPYEKRTTFLKELEKYIQIHYRPYLSQSLKPHKPNIHLSTFLAQLNQATWWDTCEDSKKLVDWFEQANEIIAIQNQKEDPDYYDHVEKKKKKTKYGLHISSVKYWWTKIGFPASSCPVLETIPEKVEIEKKRKSFTPYERRQVWNQWIGQFHLIYESPCFIGACGNKIYRDSFHMGHVVALAKGGSNHVDNLRPICETCNKTMGVENLYDFKERKEKEKQ